MAFSLNFDELIELSHSAELTKQSGIIFPRILNQKILKKIFVNIRKVLDSNQEQLLILAAKMMTSMTKLCYSIDHCPGLYAYFFNMKILSKEFSVQVRLL